VEEIQNLLEQYRQMLNQYARACASLEAALEALSRWGSDGVPADEPPAHCFRCLPNKPFGWHYEDEIDLEEEQLLWDKYGEEVYQL